MSLFKKVVIRSPESSEDAQATSVHPTRYAVVLREGIRTRPLQVDVVINRQHELNLKNGDKQESGKPEPTKKKKASKLRHYRFEISEVSVTASRHPATAVSILSSDPIEEAVKAAVKSYSGILRAKRSVTDFIRSLDRV